jgi:hypothetical protein
LQNGGVMDTNFRERHAVTVRVGDLE